MKILIVDDDLEVRSMITEQTRRLGHQTLSAADGLSALLLLKDNNDIDIIITDYRMPVLGGSDWIKLLRHYHPGIPLIIASAYGFIAEKLDKNVFFLRKPFSLHELQKALETIQNQQTG
jgi:CheY-like chemotaxis protein